MMPSSGLSRKPRCDPSGSLVWSVPRGPTGPRGYTGPAGSSVGGIVLDTLTPLTSTISLGSTEAPFKGLYLREEGALHIGSTTVTSNPSGTDDKLRAPRPSELAVDGGISAVRSLELRDSLGGQSIVLENVGSSTKLSSSLVIQGDLSFGTPSDPSSSVSISNSFGNINLPEGTLLAGKPLGLTGPTGPRGADSTVAGPTGPRGADSMVTGPTGLQGDASTVTGPTGLQGATGPAGNAISLGTITKIQNATSQIVCEINNSLSFGSGFYYYDNDADLINGYFITAAHCVMAITTNGVYVKISQALIQNPITNQWVSVNIEDIRIDGIADVALIKTNIDFTNHPERCLKLSTQTVYPGDECYVVGNPAGLDEDSISSGCVRDPNFCEHGGYQITDCVHVSAPGIGGNSGGPIVNSNGDVIGIYTFGMGNDECFGGGSNLSVLRATLPILKEGDNKQKLYLGIHWFILDAITRKTLFYSNQTSFDTNGLLIYRINESSPFFTILPEWSLLLKCVVDGTTIEFGNQNNQRSLGALLYYPVNTQVTIYYRKVYDDQVYQQVVTLNKTYADVSEILDGPLQTGY